MMIVDVTPSGLDYDAATDTAVLHFSRVSPPSSMPPRTPAQRSVDGQVLLDAAGKLVGVDLGDAYEGRRIVAMLGEHENVATTKPYTVTVVEERPRDAESILAVRIPHAKSVMRV
jgi:hypothetical protein